VISTSFCHGQRRSPAVAFLCRWFLFLVDRWVFLAERDRLAHALHAVGVRSRAGPSLHLSIRYSALDGGEITVDRSSGGDRFHSLICRTAPTYIGFASASPEVHKLGDISYHYQCPGDERLFFFFPRYMKLGPRVFSCDAHALGGRNEA